MALTEGNSFLVSSLLSLLTFSAMQVDHGRRAQGRHGPHRQGRRGPRSQGRQVKVSGSSWSRSSESWFDHYLQN